MGRHNLSNMIAAIKICRKIGIKDKKITEAIAIFSEAARRQQIRYNKDVVVIDDLAHHPSEVRATINAVKEAYGDRRLWVLYEPHTYSSFDESFMGWHKGA